MLLVPIKSIQMDFVRCLFAGKHCGKQNAVVVDVSFIPENRDFEFWRVLEDLFDASDAGHAVSNHHELLHHRAAFPAMARHPIKAPALPPCGPA